MKKIINLLGVFCLFLAINACSDDIAEEVYQKPEAPIETKESSLTIVLTNGEEGKTYVIGALSRNPFNEQGQSESVNSANFVLQKTVVNGQAVFNHLIDYYKSTLFFNVYEKENNDYTLVSHPGNQLQYQIIFGDVKRTIDLQANRLEVVKKTVFDVTVENAYNNKVLYLVKPDQQKRMEEKLKAGAVVPEDMYVEKAVSTEGKVQFVMNAPKNADTYWIYLEAPEEGIAYLKRGVAVSYETGNVSCDFQREFPKRINVTVVRDKKKLNDHEVYLVAEQDWEKVKRQVEANHGNPEIGTYVEMKRTVNGAVSFEQFCLESELKYVVYVPKWKTEYYDSYEVGRVTLTPSVAQYDVVIGDVPSTTKTVDFTVSLSLPAETILGYGAMAYILNDSGNLPAVGNHLMSGGGSFEGLYQSEDAVSLTGSVQVNGVEIDMSKEFVVFVYPIAGGWPLKMAVKRINPSEIVGTSMAVVLTETENAFSFKQKD